MLKYLPSIVGVLFSSFIPETKVEKEKKKRFADENRCEIEHVRKIKQNIENQIKDTTKKNDETIFVCQKLIDNIRQKQIETIDKSNILIWFFLYLRRKKNFSMLRYSP